MKITENFPLKTLNTFGIEAMAARFCRFASPDDLRVLMDMESDINKALILGGGSNILFTSNYDGLVAVNKISGIEAIDKSDNHIQLKIGAGVNWHEFVMYCVDKGYGGIENLSLIPGSVGAAPMQNIGAYGVELKDVFIELEAFHKRTGEVQTFGRDDCEFGYRESIFKTSEKDHFIIVSLTLNLTLNSHNLSLDYGAIKKVLKKNGITDPTIKDVSNSVISIRRSKLPDPAEIGNAGSFFKNPIIDKIDFEGLRLEFPAIPGYASGSHHIKVPAGWLIEQCGWKGKRIGNIGVHKNQALVLVNYGGGKGRDLLALSKEIQASVSSTYGIELSPEVNII